MTACPYEGKVSVLPVEREDHVLLASTDRKALGRLPEAVNLLLAQGHQEVRILVQDDAQCAVAAKSLATELGLDETIVVRCDQLRYSDDPSHDWKAVVDFVDEAMPLGGILVVLTGPKVIARIRDGFFDETEGPLPGLGAIVHLVYGEDLDAQEAGWCEGDMNEAGTPRDHRRGGRRHSHGHERRARGDGRRRRRGAH